MKNIRISGRRSRSGSYTIFASINRGICSEAQGGKWECKVWGTWLYFIIANLFNIDRWEITGSVVGNNKRKEVKERVEERGIVKYKRQRKLSELQIDKVVEEYNKGVSVKEISEEVGVSERTLYTYLRSRRRGDGG